MSTEKGVIDSTVVHRRRGDEPTARICAQDFRPRGSKDPDLLAGTSSATALRVILLHASRKAARHGGKLSTGWGEVGGTFLNAEIESRTLVRPPRALPLIRELLLETTQSCV